MNPAARLLEIMAQLRDKDKGCPWDVEQTFASIVPYTLEEAYEVADAIERKDMRSLQDELGDLLLQVVFHSQMAKEQGLFTFDDVANSICDKLVRRHPHVFGDVEIKTAAEQEKSWEHIKEQERKELSDFGIEGDMFADIPLALPALSRATKLQKRAAKVGFDWEKVDVIFDKLQEEIGELQDVIKAKGSKQESLEELGDIMFCVVNIARKMDIDAEEALRFCNHKFVTRLAHMKDQMNVEHRNLSDASLQELNDLWDQAKIAEKANIPSI